MPKPEKTGPVVLFSSFEPSGDDHAAAVIGHLRTIRPDVPIFAWGGKKMEAAGASIVEYTGKDAVMGMPGLAKIREHQHINERVKSWMIEHRPVLHVPVDSPAANFPLCKFAKQSGIRVVHMVAPQVWAWATWRIRKLRKRTDLVLCILPFEEQWFRQRNVPATFVGHPIFSVPLDEKRISEQLPTFPDGKHKLLLLPGSRPSEMQKNFPVMLRVFRGLMQQHEGLVGLVAATNEVTAQSLRELAEKDGGWPEGLSIAHSCTDAAVRWADTALVVSGTVTLQVARQSVPMVTMYVMNPLIGQIFGRLLVKTRLFTLPNLIADREIVREFIPYYEKYSSDRNIIDALTDLIENEHRRQELSAELAAVVAAFKGHNAAEEAAAAIASMVDESS